MITISRFLVAILLVSLSGCSNSTEELAHRIPGLMPVDIYKNLTDRGFTKKGPELIRKDVDSPNAGNATWFLKRYDLEECYYDATLYGENASSLYQIVANVDCPQNAHLLHKESQDFFRYLASLPYIDSNPNYAQSWIDENISKGETEVIIGSAKFILRNEKLSSTLIIESLDNQELQDKFYATLN